MDGVLSCWLMRESGSEGEREECEREIRKEGLREGLFATRVGSRGGQVRMCHHY